MLTQAFESLSRLAHNRGIAIDTDNVSELGLAWVYETRTNRGLEATPIVVDGVMYATGSWSVVLAIDAVTGEPLWTYDPEVPRSWAQKACCDVVNRGVAVYKGRVIVGTLDGRLEALDSETGELLWSTETIDPSPVLRLSLRAGGTTLLPMAACARLNSGARTCRFFR